MSMAGTKMVTGFVTGIVMLAGSGHAEEPLIPREWCISRMVHR